MPYIDITRAVLSVLAQEYPARVSVRALEREVSCDHRALQRHLRLLDATGTITARAVYSDESGGEEVLDAMLTDVAMDLLRKNPPRFSEFRPAASGAAVHGSRSLQAPPLPN